MSQGPPLRNRPNFHLGLTQLNGSPRHASQSTPTRSPLATPYPTPGDTPSAKTSYSPFPSASPKRSNGYEVPLLRPTRRQGNSFIERIDIKRALISKPLLLVLLVFALAIWWLNGGSEELDLVKLSASGLGRELMQERRMHDYRFYPATNPKFHYVGRWTSTPNRLRKDGTFPGVYFEINVSNTTSLLLSLHNAPESTLQISTKTSWGPSVTASASDHRHFHFHSLPFLEKPALPISLLAQIDNREYIVLPNASALVSISLNDLDGSKEHRIRVVAPMTDNRGQGVIELEGVWLSKSGNLLRVPGSLLRKEYDDEDQVGAESEQIGNKHMNGIQAIEKDGSSRHDTQTVIEEDGDYDVVNQPRKKIVEILTDSPGSYIGKQKGRRSGGIDNILAGVMGWEYLLGEMFGADHVGIGADGMCLVPDCIGGTGQPVGLGDVFFRSGPSDLPYKRPWMFSTYSPDVLIVNIGSSDDTSFHIHGAEYNKTLWDLSGRFETTYVSLVKAIRRLAYPKHPSVIQSERAGLSGTVSSATPASIPIFVMRPLRGQLEQATQNVVSKLRADGDKAVFWLDTSGWLTPDVDNSVSPDFFLDDTSTPQTWRLTESGNQRVAIFLHMHVCRYLAGAEEKCAFLPQEVYLGKVWDPEEAKFDKYLEDEKERKLKKLFGRSQIPSGETETLQAVN